MGGFHVIVVCTPCWCHENNILWEIEPNFCVDVLFCEISLDCKKSPIWMRDRRTDKPRIHVRLGIETLQAAPNTTLSTGTHFTLCDLWVLCVYNCIFAPIFVTSGNSRVLQSEIHLNGCHMSETHVKNSIFIEWFLSFS